MSRFRVKFLDNIKHSESFVSSKLIESCKDISIRDIYVTNSFATVTVASHDQLLSILSPSVIESLSHFHLKPIPPQDHVNNKSIFVNKLRPYIVSQSHDHILQEINDCNPVKALKVFIIHPKSGRDPSSIKVIFETEQAAEYVLANGIHLFNLDLDPSQLNREPSVKVVQCYKCFSYNHTAFICKSSNSKCSICYGNHNYRQCPNQDNPKCGNCQGNHNSTSFSCPIRKSFTAQQPHFPPLSSHSKSNPIIPLPLQRTYAQATNSSINPPPPISSSTVPKDLPLNFTPLTHSHRFVPRPLLLKDTKPTPPPPRMPVPPPPPPPPCVPNTSYPISTPTIDPFKSHEWDIKLDIWKSLSTRLAGNDHSKYADMLNVFLLNHGLSPLDFKQLFHIANKSSDLASVGSQNAPPPLLLLVNRPSLLSLLPPHNLLFILSLVRQKPLPSPLTLPLLMIHLPQSSLLLPPLTLITPPPPHYLLFCLIHSLKRLSLMTLSLH